MLPSTWRIVAASLPTRSWSCGTSCRQEVDKNERSLLSNSVSEMQTKKLRVDLRFLAFCVCSDMSTNVIRNARDNDGRTKIYLAAEAGDAVEVARFLKLKADVELPAPVRLFLKTKTIYQFIQFVSTQLHATSYCLRERPRASCSFIAQSRREHRSKRPCKVCDLTCMS